MRQLLRGAMLLGVLLAASAVGLIGDVEVAHAATQNIVVSWTDVANEDGYVVERRTCGNGTWAQVGQKLAANVVSFTDVNVAQGTNFGYRVTATSPIQNAPTSDEACLVSAGVPNKVGPLNLKLELVSP